MNNNMDSMLGAMRYLSAIGVDPKRPIMSNTSKIIGGIRDCPKMYIYTDAIGGDIGDILRYRIANIDTPETHILSVKKSIEVFENSEETHKIYTPWNNGFIEIKNVRDADGNVIECHIREAALSESGKSIPISYTDIGWLNQMLNE